MKYMRNAGITAALGVFLCGVSPLAAAPSLENAFRAPPAEALPRLRWWWPGGAVQDDELARELDIIREAGFGGAEIQAFNTGFTDLTAQERAHINDYATPEFFAHIHKLGQEAVRRGMDLDYTFGSSWPSGGGFAITPEKALTELTMAVTEVKGGTQSPVKVTIPARTKRFGALSSLDSRVKDPRAAGWIQRFENRQKLIAVVAMKGSAPDFKPGADNSPFKLFPWSDVDVSGHLDAASAVVLTDRLREDGTLDWVPPAGTWQVMVFKQYASNMGVSAGVGEGPQLTLDHMDPQAFAAHAARVGDPLGVHGAGLRSTFVDSLELMQDIAWGADFLKQFRERRGYDLTPYLPFVLQPGWMQAWGEHWSPPYFEAGDSDTAERVRSDFRRTVSDMMFAGFIEPFVAWNRAHGLKAKFQAHGGAIDVIRGYGIVDIPETEDLVDGGDPYFMRLARSGADLYGRRIISSESMVWGNRPYDVTPDEMRRRADLIFAGGVNSINVHGFNYVRGQTWPGTHAFQPSGFSLGFSTMVNPANPVWAGIPALARYIARTQAVLQSGDPVVPVAYFYGGIGYYSGIEDQGAHRAGPEKAFLAGGFDYDRINPDAIASARVKNRQLVSAGGHRYSALVLPPMNAMRAETAEAVAAFARAGLPVIFMDKAPDRDEGLADAQQRDARVRAAISEARRAGAMVVSGADTTAHLSAANVKPNLRFSGSDASGLVFVQRRVGKRTVTFLHNLTGEVRDAGIVLSGSGGVTRWDAMSGSISKVSAHQAGRSLTVPLTLEAGESALLVQDPSGKSGVVPRPTRLGAIELSQGWSLSVAGHAPRTTPLSRVIGPVQLGDLRNLPGLDRFAGVATYSHSFEAPAHWIGSGTKVTIDLGQVWGVATVTLNGRPLPPAITAPYRVDLTSALRPDTNRIEVSVASTPQNAMVDNKAVGFKNLVSVPAGLLGPVGIEAEK